jgi:hypothetical protein
MRALFRKARRAARIPVSWLPLILALAAAACQQKGSGPGY